MPGARGREVVAGHAILELLALPMGMGRGRHPQVILREHVVTGVVDRVLDSSMAVVEIPIVDSKYTVARMIRA